MVKLPSSFKQRNRTTRNFREQFAKLPPSIQDAVRASCLMFDRDPTIKSLRLHKLDDRKTGNHLPDSFSVSATMQYRAIFVVIDELNVWYWIGTHTDYDRFTGGK